MLLVTTGRVKADRKVRLDLSGLIRENVGHETYGPSCCESVGLCEKRLVVHGKIKELAYFRKSEIRTEIRKKEIRGG